MAPLEVGDEAEVYSEFGAAWIYESRHGRDSLSGYMARRCQCRFDLVVFGRLRPLSPRQGRAMHEAIRTPGRKNHARLSGVGAIRRRAGSYEGWAIRCLF